MLYIRIAGGLGNQMFQYAFAKAYSLKHNVSVKLDCSLFYREKLNQAITPRSLKLSLFPITLECVNNTPFWASQCSSRLTRKLHDYVFFPYIVKDREEGFDQRNCEKKFSKVVFNGYFQSPKYFEQYRSTLVRDFTFPENSTHSFQELSKEIKSCNATSVHIRRGDYLQAANSFLGTLSHDYYSKAIALISKKQPDSVFYFFSDDIDWCQENFNDSRFRFIRPTSNIADIDELHLMSLCKNNIIANSSFSWWGAWLNQNDHKTVILPQNWYSQPQKNAKWDIAPQGWHQL